jgi:large subunit ribosomal protein L23
MSILRQKNEYLYQVIKRPLVTEKSTAMSAEGKYSFEISKEATKIDVKKAIEVLYPGRKVKEVRTVYMPSKEKRRGKIKGRTQSGKKAIVTIEGDPIEELLGA